MCSQIWEALRPWAPAGGHANFTPDNPQKVDCKDNKGHWGQERTPVYLTGITESRHPSGFKASKTERSFLKLSPTSRQ